MAEHSSTDNLMTRDGHTLQGKALHDFLFQLYDYADTIADKIADGDPDSGDYFVSLVMIEKLFDRTGRGEIYRAAVGEADDGHLDPHASLTEAHRRIDHLRQRISNISKWQDFNGNLENAGQQIVTEWKIKERR